MNTPTPPVFLHPHEQAALGLAPLSPEAVAQMVADREAGTPGPWSVPGKPDAVCAEGYTKHGAAKVITTVNIRSWMGASEPWANASRIARLPDLEAAYLTIAAENATLHHDRDVAVVNNDVLRIAMDTLRAERDEGLRMLENSRQIERNVQSVREHEHKRAEAALAELATLRASEAAALERVKWIEKASSEFLEAYVDMINSGDCGNWDPEKEPLVIALRAALTPTADKE